MHEILNHLPSDSFVLDLGCSKASFAQEITAATAIRLDREVPRGLTIPRFVQGDAAKLPFADRTFAAVVSNHSLEHFDELDAALHEIGRVLRADGALFVAVPDASTLTDKIYRWLARGGGHVNPFISAAELAARIERATGLRHSGTRILYSSLSFLNLRNSPRPRPRRLILLGGGTEWSLCLYTWLSRRLDRYLNTRTSVYGWALYFGHVAQPIDTATWTNVCIRCGSGAPLSLLTEKSLVRSVFPALRVYECPCCGATNPFASEANSAV
jgi:SAM-dependent methyltransferase